jgi:mevalonate kinase
LKASATAPGKVILTGEHFVVYGEPALVMAINRNVHVTVEERSDSLIRVTSNLGFIGTFEAMKFKPEKGGAEAQRILTPIKVSAQATLSHLSVNRGLNIDVDSNVPVAVGLGSSGALAVATVAAVGKLFEVDFTESEIIKLSLKAEKFVHVNPSGIDQSISARGGVILYRRGEGASSLDVESIVPIVIGNTGIRRNTGKLVECVRGRWNRFPSLMKPLTNMAGELTVQATEALRQGDLKKMGELMDIDHGLLTSIGVSSEVLDRLVHASKRGGALGAKITGAGGGGCIVALSKVDERKPIAKAIHEAGGMPIIAEKTDRGVYAWLER